MPFPANWSEELISEYLELEGYFVETNHPVPINKKGGRGELDILGVKVDDGQLKIIHIETGTRTIDRSVALKIRKKFGSPTIKEIQRIARDFGFEDNYRLERWYAHAWEGDKGRGKIWNQTKRELRKEGILLMTFEEWLMKVVDAVKRWRVEHRTAKGWESALPKNLWLLKMFEALLLSEKMKENV